MTVLSVLSTASLGLSAPVPFKRNHSINPTSV